MHPVAALEGGRGGERVMSLSCVANGVVVVRIAQCHQCPFCDGWMGRERLCREAAVGDDDDALL
jgi:Zn-dependent alcohol dehydrogenase